jgi:hypothetical protein
VGQPGIEPGTSVLSGLRSNRLSYWPDEVGGGGGGHVDRRRVVGEHDMLCVATTTRRTTRPPRGSGMRARRREDGMGWPIDLGLGIPLV